MNLQARAAVIDRLLDELGNPPVVALTLRPGDIDPDLPPAATLQLETPHLALGGDTAPAAGGTAWKVNIIREELPIRVVSWTAKAVAA